MPTQPPVPPRIFISYAWTSDRIQKWVRKLSARLRRDGLDVYLDRWDLQPGDNLGEFMFDAISKNDFVLVICTPNYVKRADEELGGVGFESLLMMNDIYLNNPPGKYIAVIRQGKPKSVVPLWLASTLCVDLRKMSEGGDYPESEYQSLLHKIQSTKRKPKLGYIRDWSALPKVPIALPDTAIIKLISPQQGAIVDRFTECTGITKNIPQEFDHWLIVYGSGSKRWYPNKIEVIDSNWKFRAIIGSVECAGAEFRIGIFITNKLGSKYLMSRLDGTSILPPGFMKEVMVTRRQ